MVQTIFSDKVNERARPANSRRPANAHRRVYDRFLFQFYGLFVNQLFPNKRSHNCQQSCREANLS